MRRELDFVDHEEVGARDTWVAFGRNLVASGDVDQVERQVRELRRKGRRPGHETLASTMPHDTPLSRVSDFWATAWQRLLPKNSPIDRRSEDLFYANHDTGQRAPWPILAGASCTSRADARFTPESGH